MPPKKKTKGHQQPADGIITDGSLENEMSDHLSRLARVEIQLIMNYLDRSELLVFSRCNRQLLADADTDLAWSSQPIYQFSNLTDASDGISEMAYSLLEDSKVSTRPFLTSSIFMRHQPAFGLFGAFSDQTEHREPFQGTGLPFLVRLFEIIPRIKKVTFLYDTYLKSESWETILSHPALDGLVELSLSVRDTRNLNSFTLLASLERMVHFSTLRLECYLKWSSMNSLNNLQSLTCLQFTDGIVSDMASVTISDSIRECHHLTDCDVYDLKMDAKQFHTVFTSTPLCKNLKYLKIAKWDRLRFMMQDQPSLDLFCDTWPYLIALEMFTLNGSPPVRDGRDIGPLISTMTSFSTTSLALKLFTASFISWEAPPISPILDFLTSHPLVFIHFRLNGPLSAYKLTLPDYRGLESKYTNRFKASTTTHPLSH